MFEVYVVYCGYARRFAVTGYIVFGREEHVDLVAFEPDGKKYVEIDIPQYRMSGRQGYDHRGDIWRENEFRIVRSVEEEYESVVWMFFCEPFKIF